MNGLFKELEDEKFFTEFVRDHFTNAPREIDEFMQCEHVIDEERIAYAYGEYMQNIEKFSVLLHSSNPDHYKRAGALLHALYQSKVISEINARYSAEDVESGFTLHRYAAEQEMVPFLEFYEEYHNQMLAFDLAYRCCAAYEADPTPYDFGFLHNMCHFLAKNNNLSLDTCFMVFKALMQ